MFLLYNEYKNFHLSITYESYLLMGSMYYLETGRQAFRYRQVGNLIRFLHSCALSTKN